MAVRVALLALAVTAGCLEVVVEGEPPRAFDGAELIQASVIDTRFVLDRPTEWSPNSFEYYPYRIVERKAAHTDGGGVQRDLVPERIHLETRVLGTRADETHTVAWTWVNSTGADARVFGHQTCEQARIPIDRFAAGTETVRWSFRDHGFHFLYVQFFQGERRVAVQCTPAVAFLGAVLEVESTVHPSTALGHAHGADSFRFRVGLHGRQTDEGNYSTKVSASLRSDYDGATHPIGLRLRTADHECVERVPVTPWATDVRCPEMPAPVGPVVVEAGQVDAGPYNNPQPVSYQLLSSLTYDLRTPARNP